jgi:PTH1 family peptidyl-tRNA hydrolase
MDIQGETVRFVVGLGNPGRRYAATRHNVGWMVLDALRRRWGAGEGRETFSGRLTDAQPALGGQVRRVMLFEPHTFMNRSGEAVKGLLNFYKAVPSDAMVVLDDMALPVGRIRVRQDGSAGGHNGLKDVLRLLGTDQVPRVRVGIGEPPGVMDSVDYVLGRFSDEELVQVGPAIERAADAVELWITGDIHRVMETYNRATEPED